MTSTPFNEFPPMAFWQDAVAGVESLSVDPAAAFPVRLTPDMKIATAGSCFAEHLPRFLKPAGLLHYVPEAGHPLLPGPLRAEFNYGQFSARYGRIFTARQMRQMLERAYDQLVPKEDAWTVAGGTVRDPLRPLAQPGGFSSVEEMEADRALHLALVRKMFENFDVLVFTLSDCECWEARADGTIFPYCPGVQGGAFDPKRYKLHVQSLSEIVKDMQMFLGSLREVNRKGQVVLTLSPQALAVTAVPATHVLTAHTVGKALIRGAIEQICRQFDWVHYFPSYEALTGPHTRGRFFTDDFASVNEDGISYAAKLFLRHAAPA